MWHDMWHEIVIFGPKNAITRRKSMGIDPCIAGNDGVMRVQRVRGSGAKKKKILARQGSDNWKILAILGDFEVFLTLEACWSRYRNFFFWKMVVRLVHCVICESNQVSEPKKGVYWWCCKRLGVIFSDNAGRGAASWPVTSILKICLDKVPY